MISIKTESEIELMRESCFIAAKIRDAIAAEIDAGIIVSELNDYAIELFKKYDAESAFFGYRGYPAYICVSINDEVVHGVPRNRRIYSGDIVSLDIGVRKNGFIGDTAITVMVDVTDPSVVKLVKATEEALYKGISKAKAFCRLSDISHAIEETGIQYKLGVVKQFVGHGVGKDLHEDPQVPNFGPPGQGPVLQPGMTIAIEPMFTLGSPDVKIDEDGWTARTVDGSFAAHFEHTVLICEGGCDVLTEAE